MSGQTPACISSTFQPSRFSCPNLLPVATMFDRFSTDSRQIRPCLSAFVHRPASGSTRSTRSTPLTSPLSAWAQQSDSYPLGKPGRWWNSLQIFANTLYEPGTTPQTLALWGKKYRISMSKSEVEQFWAKKQRIVAIIHHFHDPPSLVHWTITAHCAQEL